MLSRNFGAFGKRGERVEAEFFNQSKRIMEPIDKFGTPISPYQIAVRELYGISEAFGQRTTEELAELKRLANLGAQLVPSIEDAKYIPYTSDELEHRAWVNMQNEQIRCFKNYSYSETINHIFATEHQTGIGLLLNTPQALPYQSVLTTAVLVVTSTYRHPQLKDIQGLLDIFFICLSKIANDQNIRENTILSETALSQLCKLLCNFPR